MPLLLIPLAFAALLALWLVTLPLAVWQRYRRGRARRRVQPWVIAVNAWSLLLSCVLFMAGASFAQLWIDGALAHAAFGLVAGTVVGVGGILITRFDQDGPTLFYTPNRWLVLALTILVAGRIAIGLWHVSQLWSEQASQAVWLSRQGDLLAIGGLLLGYYAAYTWALKRRVRHLQGNARY